MNNKQLLFPTLRAKLSVLVFCVRRNSSFKRPRNPSNECKSDLSQWWNKKLQQYNVVKWSKTDNQVGLKLSRRILICYKLKDQIPAHECVLSGWSFLSGFSYLPYNLQSQVILLVQKPSSSAENNLFQIWHETVLNSSYIPFSISALLFLNEGVNVFLAPISPSKPRVLYQSNYPDHFMTHP